jgi:hypothetical protein
MRSMDTVSCLTSQKLYLDLANHKLRIGRLGSRLDLTNLHPGVCTPWRSMDQLPLVASPKANSHADPSVCWSSLACRTPSNPWVCITCAWLRVLALDRLACSLSGSWRPTTSHSLCFGENKESSVDCLFEVGAGYRCRSLTVAGLSSVKARRRGKQAQDGI